MNVSVHRLPDSIQEATLRNRTTYDLRVNSFTRQSEVECGRVLDGCEGRSNMASMHAGSVCMVLGMQKQNGVQCPTPSVRISKMQ